MKRILFILLIVFSFNCIHAEDYYRAQYFSYRYFEDGSWSEWSDWEKSKVIISIDYYNEVIEIYTEQEQKYRILDTEDRYTDSKGGSQVEFSVIDQDKDLGILRIRVQENNVVQLYIEFHNIIWVYSGLHKI